MVLTQGVRQKGHCGRSLSDLAVTSPRRIVEYFGSGPPCRRASLTRKVTEFYPLIQHLTDKSRPGSLSAWFTRIGKGLFTRRIPGSFFLGRGTSQYGLCAQAAEQGCSSAFEQKEKGGMINQRTDMLDQLGQCRRRTDRLVGDNARVSLPRPPNH